jgi:ElaB/YqjD/DUF883 family membrane-anchored ribosome-binding protein
MSSRTLVAAAVLAALAVGAAGCGGGKQQVSAAELVQKGDAICKEEQSRFDEVQTHPPANASEAADQTKALVSAAEDANGSLDDLEPPESLQASYSTYLDARGRATDQIKRGQDAAENQDSATYGAAQSAVSQTAPQRHRLASALGFKVCSSGGPGAAP